MLTTMLRGNWTDRRPRKHVRSSVGYQKQHLLDSYCSSYRCILYSRHADPCGRCAFPRSLTLSTIPSRNLHSEYPDSSHVPPLLPHRRPAVRTAYVMGLVYCSGGYGLDRCKYNRFLCNAPNSGQSKGKKASYRGECRDERRELL
jgi:hypothetical protein